MSNIIDAILTLIKRKRFNLIENDFDKDAKHNDFKNYVKNLFSDSLHLKRIILKFQSVGITFFLILEIPLIHRI